MKQNVSLIILIAGNGSRMNSNTTKQMINLSGEKIFIRTLERFVHQNFLDEILLVCKETEIDYINEIIAEKFPNKCIRTTVGGKTRQDSVLNGLKVLSEDTDVVVIHDGARPFVSDRMILETEMFCNKLVIKNEKDLTGGIFAVPVKDTIKTFKNATLENVPRETLYMAQTPQIFLYRRIFEGYVHCKNSGFKATDDSMIIENIGGKVVPIMGEYFNIKITSPEDVIMGEIIMNKFFRGEI